MSEENKKPKDGQISRRSFLGKFGRIVGLAVVAVHMPFKAEADMPIRGASQEFTK